MSTGAKNMGLYYIISIKQNQGPHQKHITEMHHTLTQFKNLLRIGIFAYIFNVKS